MLPHLWTWALLLMPTITTPAPCAEQVTAPQTEPAPVLVNVDGGTLRGLQSFGKSLAKAGLKEELDFMEFLLVKFGASTRTISKAKVTWAKELAKAKKGKSSTALKQLAKTLKQLEKYFAAPNELSQGQLHDFAEILQLLDSKHAPANLALGFTQIDGRWTTPQEVEWAKNSHRIEELVKAAKALEIPITTKRGTHMILKRLYGNDHMQFSSHGIVVCSPDDPVRVRRALKGVLRGLALSAALRGQPLAVPKLKEDVFIFTKHEFEDWENTIEEALHSGIQDYADHHVWNSFWDPRGWRTSRFHAESDMQAMMLYNILEQLYPGIQPNLLVGHSNWISLRLFGQSIPSVAILKWDSSYGESTTAEAHKIENLRWLASSRGVYGSRAWLKRRLLTGNSTPWSMTVVDQVGRVEGELVLKATMVVEYLQMAGMLDKLIIDTANKENRIEEFEKSLGKSFPDFEMEWEEWFLSREIKSGLKQRLEEDSSDPKNSAELTIDSLIQVRAAAGRSLPPSALQWEEGYQLKIIVEKELSIMAQLHADFLNVHKDLWEIWPDVHFESPDRKGYTPKGNWGGSHSVISFEDSVDDAVNSWMGTFYHRLPLLEPGLFGVGYGQKGKVHVMDIQSLVASNVLHEWVVWPPLFGREIPTEFVPENPNPILGGDQSSWGYPITLQAYGDALPEALDIEIRLFIGKSVGGTEVDCHYTTPKQPLNTQLVPSHAFCLIPKSPLEVQQAYTVQAVSESLKKSLTWTFYTGD